MKKTTQFSTSVPTLLCDFYKVSHKDQYAKGTTAIYSTWTPRSNKHLPQVSRIVQFGLQAFIKKYLIEYFNENFFKRNCEEVIEEYRDFIKRTLATEVTGDHIRALHQLQYLPIKIKAIPEGKSVLPKVPLLTVENTHKDFFWLTNYFETLFSCMLWQPMTSASIAREYKKILTKYADETCDDRFHVTFQAHDFSMRGMSSLETAEFSGAGHLTSFTGTDTIPAINFVEGYYDTKGEEIGSSIPATEHSVMCSLGQNEIEAFRHLIEDVYPNGFVSIVSDTWDFWGNVTKTLPYLKDKILARAGKVVIRPDSGDPVDIICGTEKVRSPELLSAFIGTGYFYGLTKDDKIAKVTRTFWNGEENIKIDEDDRTAEQKGLIECLWEIFEGITNSKGYKELDYHIGAIYGDSITLERAETILQKLKEKGFASSNIVFGVGSFTYQFNTRDSLGFAMKSTWAIIEGKETLLYKDPKTDDGTKRSQRGRVAVLNDGNTFVDGLYLDNPELKESELVTVFNDGELLKEYSWEEIKNNVQKSVDLELQ